MRRNAVLGRATVAAEMVGHTKVPTVKYILFDGQLQQETAKILSWQRCTNWNVIDTVCVEYQDFQMS